MRGYYTITKITDFGPYITKIILPMPETVSAGKVKPACFSVYVERQDSNGNVLQLPKKWMDWDNTEPSKGYIAVKAAYPSDRTGNRQSKGEAVTLEMDYGPLATLSSPISAVLTSAGNFNTYINSVYRITQIKNIGNISGLVYDQKLGNSMPQADGWINTASTGDEPLNYGYYVPQVSGGKRPLIIWLHGAGEGGTDATIAYTANKVVALSSEKVQKLFGGAYVLAPQTTTYWLDDGKGEMAMSGKSRYVKALKAAIDQFIRHNPNIDKKRIFIGGDSNGGFMTMRMIIDYPKFFAGAFPVCEALPDDKISEEDIEKIKNIPIWFVHAKDDPVVTPAKFVVPTYLRLIAAGAENCHFTFWDHIEDIHEGFKDAKGNPYRYIGHFAWIPTLNDDCRVDYDGSPVTIDGQEVTLLQWLSRQWLH